MDSTLPHAAGRVAVATDASQTLRSVVMAFCAARGVGACTDYVVRGGAEHRVLPVRRTVAACGIRDGDVIHLSPKSELETLFIRGSRRSERPGFCRGLLPRLVVCSGIPLGYEDFT